MLMIVTFFIVVCFAAIVIYLAKGAVLDFEQNADEDVMHVKRSYLDIIARKDELVREKARLQDETDRIFNIYDLLRDATRDFDEQGAFVSFKERLQRMIHLDDCQMILASGAAKTGQESWMGYNFHPVKVKGVLLCDLAYKGLRDEDRKVFKVMAQQFALVLRRIKLYQDVEKMAIHDSLTGVYTRRHFMERLADEFRRASSKGLNLSLMMLDADKFKNINDHYGHLTGDRVLREISGIIMESIREIDIAGRFGGEEFCVAMPDTDKQGALLAAERIRESVEKKSLKVFDAHLHISISIGVATFSQDAQGLEELIDKADWSLYRSKKLGRNRVTGFSIYDQNETA